VTWNDLPPILVHQLNHPLVTHILSKLSADNEASGMSVLASGFRLDYILSRYDFVISKFWNDTLKIHKEHPLEHTKRVLKGLLKQQHELEKLRLAVLSKDHPVYPTRHEVYLDIAAEAYSKQELIRKLEGDFAQVAISTDDLGPSAVALKTLIFYKILLLNYELRREQGYTTCVSKDLLLFSELLFFEQKRATEVASFGDDTKKGQIEKKFQASKHRRVVSAVCNTTEEIGTWSNPTWSTVTAALRKYISPSTEIGSWPIAESLEPGPEAEHYENPVGFWRLVYWVSVLDGYPGFFLRAFIVHLRTALWPTLYSWPLSFLTYRLFPTSMSPLRILKWLFTDFLAGLVLQTLIDVILTETFPASKPQWIGGVVFQVFLYYGFLRRSRIL
jgi:hypothetical protein